MATDGDSSLAPLDREIVLEAVKQNGHALEYASVALKDFLDLKSDERSHSS